jgi:hypothetical protein
LRAILLPISTGAVIASGAKQSSLRRRWIASSLRSSQ